MADDDIYTEPGSNEVNFKKLRDKFDASKDNTKPDQVKPPLKSKPRESLIAQRIKHLQACETKTLQGRESIVSILPPNSNPATKSSKTSFSPDTSINRPELPKKTGPSTNGVQVLPSKAQNIREKQTSSKENNNQAFLIPNLERRQSKTKCLSIAGKENYLPDGLTVGMIVKGYDSKSYKLLALPSTQNKAPSPPPPLQVEIDLSRWMNEDESFYDDVEIVKDNSPIISYRESALRRGSTRPVSIRPISEIVPMTEEEEEEFEKSRRTCEKINSSEECSTTYDDTMEGELYDDIGEQGAEEMYEDL